MTRLAEETVESPTLKRRQPFLSGNVQTGRDEKENDNGNGKRIGEVAGGTAAECAAVCCCCPCALMHLIVLAVYKVPAGLCRKALRKHRRKKLLRRRKNDLSDEDSRKKMNGQDASIYGFDHGHHGDVYDDDGGDDNHKGADVILDLEMWDRFDGAGFWRSYSRREE